MILVDNARTYLLNMPHSIGGSGGCTRPSKACASVVEPGGSAIEAIANATLHERKPTQSNPLRRNLLIVEAEATARTVRLNQLLDLAVGDCDNAETARADLWSEFPQVFSSDADVSDDSI
jgi:hypothetical protein